VEIKIHTGGRAFNTMSSTYLIILKINYLNAHIFLNLGGLAGYRLQQVTHFVFKDFRYNLSRAAKAAARVAVSAERRNFAFECNVKTHGDKRLTVLM
jgi:hypothetical protein